MALSEGLSVPAPANSMTLSALFSSDASSETAAAGGTTGDEDTIGADTVPTALRSATSPGIVSTDTPRLPIAVCIAIPSSRGSCSGADTSSL